MVVQALRLYHNPAQERHTMKLLAIPLAIVGLVLALYLSPVVAQRWQDSNTFKRQQEQLQIEREQTTLQDYQAQQSATFTARALASNAGYLGIIVLGAVALWLGLDRYSRRKEPLVRFGGELVPRQLVESGRLIDVLERRIMADAVARIEQARNVGTPYTYAPHLSIRNDTAALLDQVQDTPAAALASIPTFADLLARGRIGRGNPLVLGYDETDASEITGSWLDLYSTIVAGMPGVGKTTTQRFLACQTALQGARFAIIDPHAGAADDSLAATLQPLSSAFVCDPASSDKAILDVVRYVADVGARRIAGKDSDTTPLILWADELTALLGRSSVGDDLAELLERIAQEYRKRFVFVCGSGQIWTASRSTSELRDSFASVVCHRMKRGQARLLLPTEEASQVERLATGHAVLWRTSGATQAIVVPNTTAGDVRRTAELLTDNQPTMPRVSVVNQPHVSQVSAPDYSVPASAKTLSPEAARIVGLFLEGKDAGAIVTEVYGLPSKAGSPYLRRLSEVQAAIRLALLTQTA